MLLLSPLPWIPRPLRPVLGWLFESPEKAGNKLSGSQVCVSVCLSRKSVMAFHSVHSIPPLLKTQEHGGGNAAFRTLPLKQRMTAELSTAGIRTGGGQSRLSHYVSFCVHLLITPPAFLSTPTIYQVPKQKRFSASAVSL